MGRAIHSQQSAGVKEKRRGDHPNLARNVSAACNQFLAKQGLKKNFADFQIAGSVRMPRN